MSNKYKEGPGKVYNEELKHDLLVTLAKSAVVGTGKVIKGATYDLPKTVAVGTLEVLTDHGPAMARAGAQMTATLAVEGYNKISKGYGKVAGLLGDVEGISGEPEGGWETDHEPSFVVKGISGEPKDGWVTDYEPPTVVGISGEDATNGWGYDYEEKKNEWVL